MTTAEQIIEREVVTWERLRGAMFYASPAHVVGLLDVHREGLVRKRPARRPASARVKRLTTRSCVIVGPDYPRGDLEWECVEHDALAEVRDGAWVCPVGGGVRYAPSARRIARGSRSS